MTWDTSHTITEPLRRTPRPGRRWASQGASARVPWTTRTMGRPALQRHRAQPIINPSIHQSTHSSASSFKPNHPKLIWTAILPGRKIQHREYHERIHEREKYSMIKYTSEKYTRVTIYKRYIEEKPRENISGIHVHESKHDIQRPSTRATSPDAPKHLLLLHACQKHASTPPKKGIRQKPIKRQL